MLTELKLTNTLTISRKCSQIVLPLLLLSGSFPLLFFILTIVCCLYRLTKLITDFSMCRSEFHSDTSRHKHGVQFSFVATVIRIEK